MFAAVFFFPPGTTRSELLSIVCDKIAGVIFFPVNQLVDSFLSGTVPGFLEWPLMITASFLWGAAATAGLRLISRGRSSLTVPDKVTGILAAAILILGPFACMSWLQQVLIAKYSEPWGLHGQSLNDLIPADESLVITPRDDLPKDVPPKLLGGHRIAFWDSNLCQRASVGNTLPGLKVRTDNSKFICLEDGELNLDLDISDRRPYAELAARLGYSSVGNLVSATLSASATQARKLWTPAAILRHGSLMELKGVLLLSGFETGLHRFTCGGHTGYMFGGTNPVAAGAAKIYLPEDDTFLTVFAYKKRSGETVVIPDIIAGIAIDWIPSPEPATSVGIQNSTLEARGKAK